MLNNDIYDEINRITLEKCKPAFTRWLDALFKLDPSRLLAVAKQKIVEKPNVK